MQYTRKQQEVMAKLEFQLANPKHNSGKRMSKATGYQNGAYDPVYDLKGMLVAFGYDFVIEMANRIAGIEESDTDE